MSTTTALIWGYFGTATKLVCQFVLTILLARLLGPEPYGIMAIAILPLGLGALVADAGFGSGLIQRQVINNSLIAQCMWWQMAIGLMLGVLLLLLAFPLTRILGCEGALPYMMAASAIFPINAMSQVPAALLRRDMRFKELQVAGVSAILLGHICIGLPLALLGGGAWALVVSTIAQALINAVIVWLYIRPSWTWRWQPWPSSMSRFSASVIGLNLANWTITNTETIALSRQFGTNMLGSYNRLTVISTGLVGMLISTLQSVLLVHHSRQQGNILLVRRQWLKTTALCAGFFGILASLLVFAPGLIISWTLGPRWMSLQHILQILALCMVANAIMSVCGPVLQALGRPEREFRIQFVIAIIAIPGLLWSASTQDLENFTWMVTGLACLRCCAMIGITIETLWTIKPAPNPS